MHLGNSLISHHLRVLEELIQLREDIFVLKVFHRGDVLIARKWVYEEVLAIKPQFFLHQGVVNVLHENQHFTELVQLALHDFQVIGADLLYLILDESGV